MNLIVLLMDLMEERADPVALAMAAVMAGPALMAAAALVDILAMAVLLTLTATATRALAAAAALVTDCNMARVMAAAVLVCSVRAVTVLVAPHQPRLAVDQVVSPRRMARAQI